MSFEIAAIDHLVLRTANMAAMLDFYGRVLGCEIERDVREAFDRHQLDQSFLQKPLHILPQRTLRPEAVRATQIMSTMNHLKRQSESRTLRRL